MVEHKPGMASAAECLELWRTARSQVFVFESGAGGEEMYSARAEAPAFVECGFRGATTGVAPDGGLVMVACKFRWCSTAPKSLEHAFGFRSFVNGGTIDLFSACSHVNVRSGISSKAEALSPIDVSFVGTDGKKSRFVPCVRKPVSPWIHCTSSFFNFVTPFIFGYWLIRFIAAGTIDPLTAWLLGLTMCTTVLFCCGAGCCRLPHCLCLWLSIVLCFVWMPLFLLNSGEHIHIDGHFNATKRIAIVGGGPSGVSAAWAIAHSNMHAQVDIYEANARFGGHSDTVVLDDGRPIDIGFIFSTPLCTRAPKGIDARACISLTPHPFSTLLSTQTPFTMHSATTTMSPAWPR